LGFTGQDSHLKDAILSFSYSIIRLLSDQQGLVAPHVGSRDLIKPKPAITSSPSTNSVRESSK